MDINKNVSKKLFEEQIEELPVDADRIYTLKYEIRFTKHVMGSTTPLVTYSACILTNTQCSTSFGKFTFGKII